MLKIKNILFIVLYAIMPLKSCDKIIVEYPELKEFIESKDFQELITTYPIEVLEATRQDAPFAANSIQIGTNGYIYKLLINSKVVDKSFCNSQEFKFILSHELGHLNDPKFAFRVFMPIAIALLTCGLGFIKFTKNIFSAEWQKALMQVAKISILLFIINLIRLKLQRDGEFFADEFGIKITKDLHAAQSVILKRKNLNHRKHSNCKLLNFIYSLLECHPSEEERIVNITKIISNKILSRSVFR